MDAIDNLLSHRTIRKFKSDLIPHHVLNLILQAAARTSTTGNMQVYSIVVTRDQEIKNQ